MSAVRYVIITSANEVFGTNNAELAEYCENVLDYIVVDSDRGTIMSNYEVTQAPVEWMSEGY